MVVHDTPTCVTSSDTCGILHYEPIFSGLFGVKLACIVSSLTSPPHIISTRMARWNKGGIPQGYKAGWWGGMMGTRTRVCAHTRTHTCTQAHSCTHTCGHTSTACVCICSSRFLEPLFPTPLLATCRGNFSCLVVEMVTCVASWCDCTSKQSRYVQLSVREDSEKSAVRNLIGLVSVGLCVLCLLAFRHQNHSQ